MVLLFRKQIYKNIFKFILFLTVASMFIGVGITALSKKNRRSSAIASIDGEIIEHRDFARREKAKREQLALMRYQFEQMGLPIEHNLFDIDSKKLAFSGLFEEVLLNRIVRKIGFSVSEDYVASKLSDSNYVLRELSEFFPAYFAMGQDFDNDRLVHMLTSNGMNVADFESYIERDLERTLVKNVAVNSLYNPTFLVKKKYDQDYAAKKFSVAKLSYDLFLKNAKKIGLADVEIANFFNEHKDTYRIPEKRSALMWEFSPENYRIDISDRLIQDYYENNKAQFIASPVKIKVRRILFKFSNDSDQLKLQMKAEALFEEVKKNDVLFSENAKQYSEDVTTAHKGGIVDFFARGEKGSAFEKAAFRLKEDGEICLAKTDEGFEIIQRLERRPVQYKERAAVSHEIRDSLIKQEFKLRFEQDMENVVHASKEGATELDLFLKNKAAKKSVFNLSEKDGSLAHDKLFSIVRGFGFYKDREKGFLIQLTDIRLSHIPELAQVKNKVIEDIFHHKAERALFAALNQENKAKNNSFTHLAQGYDAKIMAVDWLKSEETSRIKNLTEEGLPVAQMLQMEKAGMVLAYHDGRNGYLIKLDAIEGLKDGELLKKKFEINQELLRNNSFVTLNGFVASLARNAKLETHEKSLEMDSFNTKNAEQL